MRQGGTARATQASWDLRVLRFQKLEARAAPGARGNTPPYPRRRGARPGPRRGAMPDAPPPNDASGAEALLNLSAGPVRLPRLRVPASASYAAPPLALPEQQLPPPDLPFRPLPSDLPGLPRLPEWPRDALRPLPRPAYDALPPPPHAAAWQPPASAPDLYPSHAVARAQPWPPPPHSTHAAHAPHPAPHPAPHHAAHAQYAYAHAQHAPPPPYYYYPDARRPEPLPPSYSLPPQSHAHAPPPASAVSPVPPPLALPLPLPRAAPAVQIPAHDLPMRPTLPALDPKFLPAKDALLPPASLPDAPAVRKVADVVDALPHPLSRPIDAAEHPVPQPVVAPLATAPQPAPQSAPAMRPPTKCVEDPPRPARRGGLADLMNPTDKLPDIHEAPQPLQLGMKTPASAAHSAPQPSQPAVVASQSLPPPNHSSDVAQVKGDTAHDKPPIIPHFPTAPTRDTATAPSSVEPAIEPKESPATASAPPPPEKPPAPNHASASSPAAEPSDNEHSMSDASAADADPNADSEEITRCPCGSSENSGIMIACDQCNTWQHVKCMGFRRGEVPKKYFCHLCRPDEIRPTCVAHPKYKEKAATRDRERKEPKRDVDVVLAGVKPLELRKHFTTDLKQKRAGTKLSKSDIFTRYATLMRNQFGKYRQSVVDGLVIVLEMNRGEVVEKLDAALKRIRTSAIEKVSEDTVEKKRTTVPDSSPDAIASDATSIRSQGHVRNPQKRARPTSLIGDALDGGGVPRGGELGDAEVFAENDPSTLDMSTSRAMSREERKLQQTIRLIDRLANSREKKKPRTGDVGNSPKPVQLQRPKTPKAGAQPRAVSPNSGSGQPPTKPDDWKSAPVPDTAIDKNEDVVMQDCPELQPPAQAATTDAPVQQAHSRKTSPPRLNPESEPLRESNKRERDREREPRSKERSDRISLRRRDSGSPDANTTAGNGRRRGLLDRERSQENKRRRVGALTREAERRTLATLEEERRQGSLDFKLFVPGPSVLGSRNIVRQRLSKLDRERFEAEEATVVKTIAAGPRTNRKARLLEMAPKLVMRSRESDNKKKAKPPAKKRYHPLENRMTNLKRGNKEDGAGLEKTPNATRKKASVLSVSMVVVSEKGNLPDKGEKLESSRLILHNGKPEEPVVAPERKRASNGNTCIKKRARMFPQVQSELETIDAVMKDVAKRLTPPPEATVQLPHSPSPASPSLRSPKCAQSPQVAQSPGKTQSPRAMHSPSSPVRIRSPMLRSSPVPAPRIGLRSVSPATIGKPSISGPSGSPPRSRHDSPRLSQPCSPSPEVRQQERSRKDDKQSMDEVVTSKVTIDTSAREASMKLRYPLAPVPLSKTKVGPPDTSIDGLGSPSTPQVSQDGKSGLSTVGGLGLLGLRSAPVPETRMESPRNEESETPAKKAVSTPNEELSPSSPKHQYPTPAETTITISDIFQQRLEGFLKPSTLSPLEESIVQASQPSPRSTTGSPLAMSSGSLSTRGGKPGVSGNGVPSLPLHSLRSRPVDNSGSWRGGSSFMTSKRPNGSFDASKGSPAGDSTPRTPNVAGPGSAGDKPHFRSSRADPPGRSDHGRPRQAWNNYSSKNGWMTGSGRGPHSSNEGNSKASRRGR